MSNAVVNRCSHLERNLFEVEFIAHVVVGAHSFRVVVDHDRLVFELRKQSRCKILTIIRFFLSVTHSSQLLNTTNSTPIKLHTATDAVHSRSQHHRVSWRRADVTVASVVGEVEVVGVGWPLCGDGVDLFDARSNAEILADLAHNRLGTVEEMGRCLNRCA